MIHDQAVEVLLVEDNPTDVDLAMHALARGHLADKVHVVRDGAEAEDRDLAAAYDLGVNSYIVKPVDIDQFFDTIQRLGFYWAVMNRPQRHPRAARL